MLKSCIDENGLNEERVLHAVDVVSRSSVRDRFAILKQFRRLIRTRQRQFLATVESAVPLSPEMQQRIEQDLQRVSKAGLHVSFAVNPDLIGGMRIQAADDVYDGSVRGKLTELERTFSDVGT